jgi:hypothetical protein
MYQYMPQNITKCSLSVYDHNLHYLCVNVQNKNIVGNVNVMSCAM